MPDKRNNFVDSWPYVPLYCEYWSAIYIYIHIDIKVYCREEDHQAGFLIAVIESLLGLEGISCCDHLTKTPFIALLNNHVMLQEEIVYCLCLFV